MADDIRLYEGKKFYFIGIGGCSMSGLAQILRKLGFDVSGSDARESVFTQALTKQGITVNIGHSREQIEGAEVVVYTAAIKPDNPEYSYAVEKQLPMIERSKLLGMISSDYEEVVCIAGCHGKTTITSMLAKLTKDTASQPTIHVGGMVDFLGGGVKLGDKSFFVTEACEYVRSFLALNPKYIVLNNIDDDHLDYYKDINDIMDAFVDFLSMIPEDGLVFLNMDDENACEAVKRANVPVITYSITQKADYHIRNIQMDQMGCPSFDVIYKDTCLGNIKLNVPGMHNAANSLAAIAVAYSIFSVNVKDAAERLLDYRLAGRRFELIGERDGVKIFHDYAHHPSEIKACLAAAKLYPHHKLWAIFQCNSFTRARTLKQKYALAFEDADVVLMPDLFPGRDIDKGDIHSKDIVELINAHSKNCIYLPTFSDIKDYLLKNWQSGDIVVTLGSGDVNKQQMILMEK